MNANESKEKFERSKELFQSGSYSEAMLSLYDLDRAHPNNVKVLFPMAMCYEKLGQKDKAIEMSQRLVNQFQHEKAQAMLERLERPEPEPDEGLFEPEQLLPVQKEKSNKNLYIVVGVIVAILLLLSPILISMLKGGD